jgi:hypothetical protein
MIAVWSLPLFFLQVMHNNFWKRLNELVDLCWPIVLLLREADSGKPMVGQVRAKLEREKAACGIV